MKKNLIFRFIAAMTAAVMTLTPLPVCAENEAVYEEILPEYTEEMTVPYEQHDETLPAFTEPVYTPMFSFPDNIRGINLAPQRDFAVIDGEGNILSEEEIAENIGAVLDRAINKHINTAIISTADSAGNTYFGTGVNRTLSRAPMEVCVDEAAARGMYVYLTFDINTVFNGIDETNAKSRIDRFALTVHEFTVRYPVDGIIFTGYYSKKSTASFTRYMDSGAGIGYENWLRDNGAYVFSLAADAVRRTTNSVPVGISIDDVWANSSTRENGSPTNVSFEALTDGYADTLGYIMKGCADFIYVKADGSFGSAAMPFEDSMGWWDSVAEKAGIPMIIDHMNEKICTDAMGWESPDELVKQVIRADSFGTCIGSSFNSLAALENNPDESTDVLMKHFEDKIDIEGLNNELEMNLPLTQVFKTEEPSVIFAGSFDPNFTIYFQDKPIELNEAGRFYFNMELDVGVNTFTFRNKGKEVKYKITRTVNVIKSVEPAQAEMRVEEKSAITLSAVAYKGSVVNAEINGKSVDLSPVDGQTDDLDPNSNYTRYVGTYVAPAGIKGQDIDLGTVRFYGTYHTRTGDFNESRTGSRIIVNALAEILNDYSGKLLEVKNDNTMVYNAKTTSTAPTPDMARLPAGTLDYQVKTVSYSGTDYYLTNSGKRIRVSDVNVLDNKPLGSNPISVAAAGKSGTDTVIKLSTSSRVPFAMAFSGVNYSDGVNGGYYISDFSAGKLVITFDYITSISSGDITFPDSAVFTNGTWDSYESGELKKTTLTLTLRQNGVFGGVTSFYDSEGLLTFRFNGCRSSLDGATIVIDPGHGYTGASTFDPGAIGHIKEQEANLAIAKLVEQKLINRGANVVRLKTESETYVTAQRASIARQYDPDVFIAVHCNAAAGESAKGSEAYYFTPYSQPLAKAVTARIGSYLGQNVHNASGMDRGARYNYFFVTQQQDFPSILIECGFVTNYTEAMALANATHQDGIAEAIVQGIADFLGRTDYSCYGEGEAHIEGGAALVPVADVVLPVETPENTETAPPVYEEPPADSNPPIAEIAGEVTVVSSAEPEFFDPYDIINPSQ